MAWALLPKGYLQRMFTEVTASRPNPKLCLLYHRDTSLFIWSEFRRTRLYLSATYWNLDLNSAVNLVGNAGHWFRCHASGTVVSLCLLSCAALEESGQCGRRRLFQHLGLNNQNNSMAHSSINFISSVDIDLSFFCLNQELQILCLSKSIRNMDILN